MFFYCAGIISILNKLSQERSSIACILVNVRKECLDSFDLIECAANDAREERCFAWNAAATGSQPYRR